MQELFLLDGKKYSTYINAMLIIDNHLKFLRKGVKRCGLPPKEFAERAGISRRTLDDYEASHWSPSLATMRAIEGALAKLARRDG